jgi:hypothetical protein
MPQGTPGLMAPQVVVYRHGGTFLAIPHAS